MNLVFIILMIAGCVLVIASFIFKDVFSDQSSQMMWTEDDIERLVERRFNEVKVRLDDEAEKSADQIKDQTERELEKLSNEKIMAVNEYSDQVMDQINKNHNEVMFLYSMLSDKQKELDYAVEKLNRVKQRAENEEKLEQRHIVQENKADIQTKAAKENKSTEKTVDKTDKSVKARPAREPGQPDKKNKAEEAAFLDEKSLNKEQILKMDREGMSSLQIAQELQLGIGEVRLVLELSKERRKEE